MPLVSVIIVDYGKVLIEDCLASLNAQTFRDFEIIVVDNNKINRGFASGCNDGIRRSKGKYIALLNNDARANKYWLGELVKTAMFTKPEVGMVASKVLRLDGTIESTGCYVYPDGNGMCIRDGRRPDFPSGCAALYSKEMLDKIGVFDESFFCYNEDTDFGIRAIKAGYRCEYNPHAVVTHIGSASTSRNSLKKLYWVERNRIKIMLKHFTFHQIIASIPWTIWRYMKGGR